jgi:rubredoxin
MSARKVCAICGWVYDPVQGYPKGGVKPGTPWEQVAEDFRCPKCGAKRKWFKDAG